MSQPSSILRIWPIPLHNLLEQLLKLEEKFTVHCVQSKVFLVERTYFLKLNFIDEKMLY